MRSLLPLACACLALGVGRPALAGQEREVVEPPPANHGTGLLVWGSVGVGLGITGIAGGTAMWIALSGEGGWLGAIPIVFGGSLIALGGVGIHVGKQRRRALREWEHRAGVDVDRPARAGVGLLSAGITSLAAGASVAGFGFAYLPPLATYEPGDAPVALAGSITGTILMVAGVTTTVMGAMQRHRYLHRSARVVLNPYPWATTSAVGFGLAGSF